MLASYITRPFRFVAIKKHLPSPPRLIVDIGIANRSPEFAKREYPRARYCGIDLVPPDAAAASCVDEFYQLDLTQQPLPETLAGRADLVILSHIIEHLLNGSTVIGDACRLLAPGGVLYIEWPGLRSTHLPSMSGSLNFWDDPTHVRLYQPIELMNIIMAQGLRVLAYGPRRYWRLVFLGPLLLPIQLLRRRMAGWLLWDLLGFAEYVIAKRA